MFCYTNVKTLSVFVRFNPRAERGLELDKKYEKAGGRDFCKNTYDHYSNLNVV